MEDPGEEHEEPGPPPLFLDQTEGRKTNFLETGDPIISGAPNVNFRKITVRKTIWDLEFSEQL